MSLYDGGSEPSYSQGPKKFSCRLCHQRKVRCDRNDPCGYCSRRQDVCVYETPPPPKRRKRAHESEEGQTRPPPRLDDKLPAQPRTDTASSVTAPTPEYGKGSTISDALREACGNKSASDGRLISDQGRTRYLDKYVFLILTIVLPGETLIC
jgi:Fungal Zn(2)-Cys(6) binuclear cluster domain